MARFSLAILALALAGACAQPPKATPPASVVTPAAVPYTCAEQRQAAGELDKLGPGSMLGRMIADYGRERRQLRAANGQAEPAPCAATSY